MDKELIEKTIRSNNESCPQFNYENPLLDRNVASALSKSFVRILKISDQNSSGNNNLRLSVLENIRKLCISGPEDHKQVDENVTDILTAVYEKNLQDEASTDKTPMQKMLDAFFVKQYFSMEVQSSFKSHFNPETLQALTNINENGRCLEMISKEIIHWNSNTTVLKDIWEKYNDDSISERTLDDISIKIKPEIEQMMLKNCCKVLEGDIDLDLLFTTEESLMLLVKTSAKSPICFQMCCCILNHVVKMTNYDHRVRNFISTFVRYVKLHCKYLSFSVLYPMYLSHVVVLLDIDINAFPPMLKQKYIEITTGYLQEVNETSDTDLVLLLTHFPAWFDIFFGKINTLF